MKRISIEKLKKVRNYKNFGRVIKELGLEIDPDEFLMEGDLDSYTDWLIGLLKRRNIKTLDKRVGEVLYIMMIRMAALEEHVMDLRTFIEKSGVLYERNDDGMKGYM